MTCLLKRTLQIFSIFWVCSSSWCMATSFTLEDQLLQLKRENEIFTLKFSEMEARLTKLEALELKFKQLESYLNSEQIDKSIQKVALVEDDDRLVATRSSTKSVVFRTCRETRAADPSLTSGMYWIDPDGQGVGDDPIHVYCDMISGSTSILHDSEAQIDVGHCTDPGCYSRPITYSASMRQMAALAELSNTCHQSYDCNFAPLEINGVTYAWWNDKNGNPQYFWSGSNSSVHTCQCGIDQNCVEDYLFCNCDSAAPIPLNDDGIITDKNILPITRLNFGRTQLETSSGIHTLGRFVCTGQVAVNGMPTSCADLWRIGHTLNGLYSVTGTEMVESVYCDFTKLPYESNFQTWIGYSDIKSSPTYFHVQKNTPFNITNTPIPFEVERLNVGGAMNKATGIFTAPRAGKYFFSFTGIARSTSTSPANGILRVALILNGNEIGRGLSHASSDEFQTVSIQSALNLKAGDQVWSIIHSLASSYLFCDNGLYNHFTGWLLQENVLSPSRVAK